MPTPSPARRQLTFSTIAQAVADAEALARAERAGTLQPAGAWTLGQALNHMGTWTTYPYVGVPLRLPWFVRMALRPMKRRFLYKPMRAGLRIPKVPNGTLAIDVVPLEQGLASFVEGCARLEREAPTEPHPFLGRLAHDEWKNLHLRHAELHLSFFRAG